LCDREVLLKEMQQKQLAAEQKKAEELKRLKELEQAKVTNQFCDH
jgi:hypothetical protein